MRSPRKMDYSMGDKTAAKVGTPIFPYVGHNSHELVSGNGSLPWHRKVGYIDGRVLINL